MAYLTLYIKNTERDVKEKSDNTPNIIPYVFLIEYTYKGIVNDNVNVVHKKSVNTKQYPSLTDLSYIWGMLVLEQRHPNKNNPQSSSQQSQIMEFQFE